MYFTHIVQYCLDLYCLHKTVVKPKLCSNYGGKFSNPEYMVSGILIICFCRPRKRLDSIIERLLCSCYLLRQICFNKFPFFNILSQLGSTFRYDPFKMFILLPQQ